MKLLFFSSTRADASILYPFYKAMTQFPEVDISVLSTGTHLNAEFGMTGRAELERWHEATVHEVVIEELGSDSAGTVRGLAKFQAALPELLAEVKPDLALVLGDRAETLSFAFVCNLMDIAIAHFHGGELSLGSLDENFRHSISKLSSIHFPASEAARDRLIMMGESPTRVHYFGNFARERTAHALEFSREELETKFAIRFGAATAFISMHGARFDQPNTAAHLEELFCALQNYPELTAIFTGPNADPESRDLRTLIFNYCQTNSGRAYYVESFGEKYFWSFLKRCDIAIGNSSSLIHETPELGIPTVIIGSRQNGRLGVDFRGLTSCEEISAAIGVGLERERSHSTRVGESMSVAESIAQVINHSLPISRKKEFWSAGGF